jgi:hypothetical protein
MKVLRRFPANGPGFLALTRLLVRDQYEDGPLSPPRRFEIVERRGFDSVVMIPYFRRGAGIQVLVKARLRPVLFLRGGRKAPGKGMRPRSLRAIFPSDGQCTERVHLLAPALAGKRRLPARGDGSVNGADAWSFVLKAKVLLRRCRTGEVEDPKLEIGVQRLLEFLAWIHCRG